MKSVLGKAILIFMFSASSFALPFPKASLLKLGSRDLMEGAANSRMTPSAVKEFLELRNLAREVRQNYYNELRTQGLNHSSAMERSKELTSDLEVDTSLVVLERKINQGLSTGLVHIMDTNPETGESTRSLFEIPAFHEKLVRLELDDIDTRSDSSSPRAIIITGTYVFTFPKYKKVSEQISVGSKKLSDGKIYRVVYDTTVRTENELALVNMSENHRAIHVLVGKSGSDQLPESGASGTLELSDAIKGELVGVSIDSSGTRLTFQTTYGYEYIFSIERKLAKEPNSRGGGHRDDALLFSRISETRIVGKAWKSFQAAEKVYRNRTPADKVTDVLMPSNPKFRRD